MAFKPGSDESAESLALKLRELLQREGAEVLCCDPCVAEAAFFSLGEGGLTGPTRGIYELQGFPLVRTTFLGLKRKAKGNHILRPQNWTPPPPWFQSGRDTSAFVNPGGVCGSRPAAEAPRSCLLFLCFSPTAESPGVPAQLGCGVARGGPEVRFNEGYTRAPPGFHEGSTRFGEGCGVVRARKRCCWGCHLSLFFSAAQLLEADLPNGFCPSLLILSEWIFGKDVCLFVLHPMAAGKGRAWVRGSLYFRLGLRRL